MKRRRRMGTMPGSFCNDAKTAAFMSPRPSRITRKASLKPSKPSIPRPAFRPTISIRSRISGDTSKKRCSPIVDRITRAGKPSNLSGEEKQAITALESADEGFVHRFRHIIRQLVNIFDYAHSEAHAKLRLQQLRQDIQALGDPHLDKIPQFFDDHWDSHFTNSRS